MRANTAVSMSRHLRWEMSAKVGPLEVIGNVEMSDFLRPAKVVTVAAVVNAAGRHLFPARRITALGLRGTHGGERTPHVSTFPFLSLKIVEESSLGLETTQASSTNTIQLLIRNRITGALRPKRQTTAPIIAPTRRCARRHLQSRHAHVSLPAWTFCHPSL